MPQNDSQNAGKHFTYVSQFIIKDTSQEQPVEVMHRSRNGGGSLVTSMGTPWCIYNLEALEAIL